MWSSLFDEISLGVPRKIARAISLVENQVDGYEDFLRMLQPRHDIPLTGITGPPGAGKSTLTDGIIRELLQQGKKTAVLCIDPSSPFHSGALLGDRIRMRQWYDHPDVYIRSLSARGALGGLSATVFEIADILRTARFDHILIETVGVGQNEVDIASLADTTVLVLVPEAGDDIQNMKSGLMEVADIFVVNKADRPDADIFLRNLRQSTRSDSSRPVLATKALTGDGLGELTGLLLAGLPQKDPEKHFKILAGRVYQQVQKKRMRDFSQAAIIEDIRAQYHNEFNLYAFAEHYIASV